MQSTYLCVFRAIMTHASVPAEQRAELGITDNLIRMSVGIEDEENLVADIKQALQAAVSNSIAAGSLALQANCSVTGFCVGDSCDSSISCTVRD